MIVRQAKPTDASTIARIHVDTWRNAYKEIIPDEVLNKLSYEKREKMWSNTLNNKENKSIIYVGEIEPQKVVGFVDGGKERMNNPLYKGELYGIYILEEYQRKELGKLLVQSLVSELLKTNIQSMLVWVLADNPYRRFYESLDGKQVGEKFIKMDDKKLKEIAYGWSDINSILKSITASARSHLISTSRICL